MTYRALFPAALGLLAGLAMLIVGAASQAQSSYRLQPGDTVKIEVLEDPSLDRSALVLPDGTISFPFMGSLRVASRTVDQVARTLTDGLAPNFAARPTVVVSVGTLAEREIRAEEEEIIAVYAMGEIETAGRLEVEPGTTILQFLAAAGGLTPFAAGSRIELHRTDAGAGRPQVFLFSYDGRGKGQRISPATPLAEGDVIVVPQRRLFE